MGNCIFAKPGICDLPIDMRLEIFEKLSLHELVVNSSKTCHQWRDDIAQHILAPKILALAEVNEKFKMDIKEKGWAEEANNPTELLVSLYNKYDHFKRRYMGITIMNLTPEVPCKLQRMQVILPCVSNMLFSK